MSRETNLPRIVLLGSPNAGKTTCFNGLTAGYRGAVANRSGVTLDSLSVKTDRAQWFDLPGVYDLVFLSPDSELQEERVVWDCLHQQAFELILNVVDARHLSRQLLLTASLRPLGWPMGLIITHASDATREALQQRLMKDWCVPVWVLPEHPQPQDWAACRQWAEERWETFRVTTPWALPTLPEGFVETLYEAGAPASPSLCWAALEGYSFAKTPPGWTQHLREAVQSYVSEEWDEWLADRRLEAVQAFLSSHAVSLPVENNTTQRWDAVLLYSPWAWPAMALILGGGLGGVLALGIELQNQWSDALLALFQTHAFWEKALHAFPQVQGAVQGVARGLATVLGFFPLLWCVNALLMILEHSGYMVRVTVLWQKALSRWGLSGGAFIPLILGLGCNVPAILSARGLKSSQERLLTVMMSPFMSCSARLVVYVLFAKVFFPDHVGAVVAALYGLGMTMALLTNRLMRAVLGVSEPLPMMVELPLYLMPSVKQVARRSTSAALDFLKQSLWVTVPLCAVLGAMTFLPEHTGDRMPTALTGWMQVFAPMGLGPAQWPLCLGLIVGLISKELLAVTVGTVYALGGDAGGLAHALSPAIAAGYLVFVSLYSPCVSTCVAMARVLGVRWAVISVLWSVSLAYGLAVMVVQLPSHPAGWHGLEVLMAALVSVMGVRWWMNRRTLSFEEVRHV